ncbi:hypothetical protein SG1766 [Sodalis glossinidius str. 'morsitans']|uniref:Uncharacterized protein n=1 Tax=Sodalis glossinidius (strain morsitans) TaxID=343509 RepID=Q2NS34_SODGM|nr:hypothetical protein SG1766 [Sodalis glossinidius str. 'morsitans']
MAGASRHRDSVRPALRGQTHQGAALRLRRDVAERYLASAMGVSPRVPYSLQEPSYKLMSCAPSAVRASTATAAVTPEPQLATTGRLGSMLAWRSCSSSTGWGFSCPSCTSWSQGKFSCRGYDRAAGRSGAPAHRCESVPREGHRQFAPIRRC